MPFLVLAFAALVGFGFVGVLFAIARAAPPHRADGPTLTFRHGRPLRGFALLAVFGAPLVFGLWILFFPPQPAATRVPVVLAAALLGLAGVLLLWEAFQFELTVSPAGLDCRSPWKGRFRHAWEQVTALEYSPLNAWFALKFQDGSAFHLSTLVPGVMRFLDACEARLPPDRMAGAKRGYQSLRRKWPF